MKGNLINSIGGKWGIIMSVLTQEKIKLAGFDEFDNCTFLEIENKISMHPTAILMGEISNFEKKNNIFL